MEHLFRYQYLYLFPLLLSAIFSLKSFRQKWPGPYKLIAVLVIVTLLTEIAAIGWKWYWYNMFSRNYSKNNIWIYNVFVSIHLGLSFAIFYYVLNNRLYKKVIMLAILPFLLLGSLNYLLIQGPFLYNTYTVIPVRIAIIALCIAYFKQLLEEPKIIALRKEPLVWFTIGTFLYLSVTLPYFIMFRFLNKQSIDLSLFFLSINDTLNLFLCSCYLISFLCKPQSPQPL
jgi:hypothetical protein